MTQAHLVGAARSSRAPRHTSPHLGRRAALATALATALVTVSVAVGPGDRPATEAAADTDLWVLVGTEANPTGDTEREGWTVAASDTSISVDVMIFPDDPNSTAEMLGAATWEPFPDTLIPGQALAVPVTVETSPAVVPNRVFYSGFTAIALVDDRWNDDAIGVDASCTESGAELVCTAAAIETDTLDYAVPGYGDELRLGVGALNCGGACQVDWIYEYREAPPTTTMPPDTTPADTTPADTTVPASTTPEDDVVDAPTRASALSRLTPDDLERFDALVAVWRVLADGALSGRTSLQSLQLLQDLVDDYFSELILRSIDEGDDALTDALRSERVQQLEGLDRTIDEARKRAADDALGLRTTILQQVLFGGVDAVDADPDPRVDQVLDLLRDRDDLRAVFDGLLVGDPEATSGEPNEWRTVRFANIGSDAVTVRPATYEPASDVVAPLTDSSTVVFPEPNPSAALALPRGTYTFCYDWDLGTDDDGDGFADERHALTGEITLGDETPSDVDRAPVMTLDPTGGSPGSCPGAPAPTGPSTPAWFTPQEAAADGLGTYDIVCTYRDGFTEEYVRAYRFVIGDAVTEWWDEENGTVVELFWTDTNRYETVDGFFEVGFTDAGFDVIPLSPDDDGTCVATRRR